MIGQLLNLIKLAAGRPPRTVDLPGGDMYVLLPKTSKVRVNLDGPNRFLESDAGRSYRSQIALELMDDNVHGFMLLLLKHDDHPEITFRSQTQPQWREAFAAALGTIAITIVD